MRRAEPAEIATAAMSAMASTLHAAGCLVEPIPQPPALTVEDAAKLLCRLSCSPRLSDPDEDYQQLLRAPAMVDYAWKQALAATIPPDDQKAAHAARRLLLEHHRPQS